jgi:tripartite ATP-independent transporter DctP family solute receptor
MQKRTFGLLAGLLLAGVALPAGLAHAQDIQERTIRLSCANNQGHPQVIGAEKFAELVEEKSGGKIEVKIFEGGVLGADLQNFSAMQGGTLDMNVGNASLLAGNVKEFAIFDFPFLFHNPEEAYAVMDGPVGKKLLDKLPERGLVGLAYWELGFRNINNAERPIEKVEDLEGLKMRVIPTPIYVDFMNGLGANAVPMPFTETYTALETGAIDGMTNPLINIVDSKFYEVTDYLTITNHMYNPQSVTISKITWDKLSDDEKKILQDAATEATAVQREASQKAAAEALTELEGEMDVNELSAEELAKMQEKVKPVIEKYTADVGAELVAEVMAELEKVRAKN